MKLLLITPPMTQINTPYPATGYLTHYLSSRGHDVDQCDLGLELALKLFSHSGLARVRAEIEGIDVGRTRKKSDHDSVQFFLEAFEDYQSTVEPTIRFLQGRDATLALRIAARKFLPEGPRFLHLTEHSQLLESFGVMGVQDKAKYLASLYLDDLADVIRHGVDERFEFSKYAESLAASQVSFDPLYKSLHGPSSLIDEMIAEMVEAQLQSVKPDVVGVTCPFPGNVYGALRLAMEFKKRAPHIHTVMGGGYVNTELRQLSDKRFFEAIDYLIFDDGERALENLLEFFEGRKPANELLRTWYLHKGEIVKSGWSETGRLDVPFKTLTGPTFRGLPLQDYVSMLELPNPMHRMWSDFRWNKMILAHGCYWKKCTFCDVNLDYIQRFEPARATDIVDAMERLVKETGTAGFHFVDEAAPPALLKAMSVEILKRRLKVSWWGNLRFDPQFTPAVAELMSDAGCVAVTGGLEVASPRVLKLINKGIDIEQVARVTHAFKSQGIFVHAYLMYGFASQSEQETIDSLEVVRQLFVNECLDSAHWHRFLVTVHSPVGRSPEKFNVKLKNIDEPKTGYFAVNEVPFIDATGVDHGRLGRGLRKALYNYMHGIGLKEDVRVWFEGWHAPKTQLKKNYIASTLSL